MEGLRDLHATIDEATEALAAFVSVARSNESAPELLVELAGEVVSNLTEWRTTLRQLAVAVAKESPEVGRNSVH